jgi:valyl-tRNA synthetase
LSARTTTNATLQRQSDDFVTLAKAGSCSVLTSTEEAPSGCAVHITETLVSVYVQLKGLVDFEAEIKKLEVQLSTKVQPVIDQIESKVRA